MTSIALPHAGSGAREQALSVLLGRDLEPIVDLVAWRSSRDVYEVASSQGHARFRRVTDATTDSGHPHWSFEVEAAQGQDPIGRQDPSHFGDLKSERATPFPLRRENSYPHAFEHISQLFDHPSAPDLVVLHTPAHHWGDQGGHLGEHGSLGVVQARAPFIAAGAGVARLGLVNESCRLVDVAPTILELLGAPAPSSDHPAARLSRQDGSVLSHVVAERGRARHVVAMLLDGTNANVLTDLAERGELANIGRLMALGTTYRHGAIASLPTVTLANHTSILTGCHPGHHGVLHNAWIDRVTGSQVVTNSPSTWTTSMNWLERSVETVHHGVHRMQPGALSVSINEPCDVGADFSVFDLMRRGEPIDRPPPLDEIPDATERFVRPSKSYQWSTLVDHTAVEQFCGIWGGDYRGRSWIVPTFTWVNFTLTDAAFHEGGPYSDVAAASLRDTDARIGRILEAVERRGVFEETAFVVVADHGMELSNPAVTGDWDVALARAGVPARDEGYGFIYLSSA